MRYIDVHCHLNYKEYGDLGELFKRLNALGVEKVICAGCDVGSSLEFARLADKYKEVYFTAGIQPTETHLFNSKSLGEIEKIASHEKCVAIGEIGLDYHYPDTDKATQLEAFERQIELANSLCLPVQIHSRDCAEDMLNTIKRNIGLLGHGFAFHCYSHSSEIAVELERLGAYFSFGGTSTYGGSRKVRKTITILSENRIMTETDSPYLPPLSKCGQFPNTPESIPEILENMAKLKCRSEKDTADMVWSNAHSFFKKLN